MNFSNTIILRIDVYMLLNCDIECCFVQMKKKTKQIKKSNAFKKKMKKKAPPRFELGLQDSESWVLTITPWSRLKVTFLLCYMFTIPFSFSCTLGRHHSHSLSSLVCIDQAFSDRKQSLQFVKKSSLSNYYKKHNYTFSNQKAHAIPNWPPMRLISISFRSFPSIAMTKMTFENSHRCFHNHENLSPFTTNFIPFQDSSWSNRICLQSTLQFPLHCESVTNNSLRLIFFQTIEKAAQNGIFGWT